MSKSVPTFIDCPFCAGTGGTGDGQCEECFGEGEIHIKEYADAHGWTEEDAYNSLRSECGDDFDEEEDEDEESDD